jgi:HD-GYP domain-containing protein (c-di-GMP phosphodiesterase class II)
MSDSKHIHDFLRHLLSATANASLYSVGHPQVTRLSAQAFECISEIFQTRSEVTFLVVGNELIIDGQPQDLTLFLVRFTQILKSHGIGSIKLSADVTKAEIDALISGLASRQMSGEWSVAASGHIRLGTVDIRSADATGTGSESGASPRHLTCLPDMPKEELARFMDIYETVKKNQRLQINGVFDVVSGFIDVFRQEGKPLLAMAALRETDEYTFTHSTNVCVLNLAQAMALGIEGQLLNDIGVAAMLHDIGKLFVPEEILTKTDKLSHAEFEIMKQHPVRGARHLLETPGVPRLAAVVAYEHHLKFNLSGYPKVSAGWQQNLCSHMTMISDFFDALRTRRSYREPMPLQTISEMMQEMMGTELHPVLTKNFLRLIEELADSDETGSGYTG